MSGEGSERQSAHAEFYICPQCGSEVRVGSKRCFHCQPQRSWEQDGSCDGLDLADSDEDWDYADFVRREFDEGGQAPGGRHLHYLWAVVAGGLVIVMLWLTLAHLFAS